ncbi:MAG: dienelactone hydrolase family protein [Pseudomonadota bacterium]|nr:dienelactone hydrolase family protein [Pseudomonadota bacterium]
MPDITISSLEGKSFGAYCAMPASGNGPGLVICQEIFGVNAVMRKICDDFAAKGYIAVCPDLFWRQKPGIQISDKTPGEWDQAMDLFKGFDVEAGLRDLLSTLGHVRAIKGCSGKVGSIGFCLGGKMAYLMASRSDVDAAVSYYGVELDKKLDEIQDIRAPLILHIAELDKFVPAPVREKILKAAARNPVITTYVYNGVDHAFARPGGQNFNAAAAALAGERTETFFAAHLQG